jgi:catechol 2,3-dioxygenase-like lactoylglutathione lyase family enzyme
MRLYPGLSAVTLGVRSVERATVFYEMLGWRRVRTGARATALFQLNNIVLRLAPSDALARDLGAPAMTPLCAHSQHYRDRASVLRALETAERAGAGALRIRAVGRGETQGLAAAFMDPDGHVWDIVHDPRLAPTLDGGVDVERG